MASELANHWSLESSRLFLNHGSFGACPDFVITEQRKWQDLMEQEPVRFFEELMPDLLLKLVPKQLHKRSLPLFQVHQ